jgi:SAM-dependent methyltransferase
MTLSNFFNSIEIKSDKGTFHDYIDGYYSKEFSSKKEATIRLLEIGVGQAHSIYLWKHYFTNGHIIGLESNKDLVPLFITPECVEWIGTNKTNATIKLCDAYSDECISQFSDNYFDYIIDDGPHSLSSQIMSIQKYINKLKPGGKLIIEDIQNDGDLNILIEEASRMQLEYSVFDLRANKNRYDDILLEIVKK